MDRLGAVSVEHDVRLSDLTTFRIGGSVQELVTTETEYDFVQTILETDRAGTPLLVLGGGSNLLCADAGFAGRVIRDGRISLISEQDNGDGTVSITAPAGMDWATFVDHTVEAGYSGVEALAGIPGSVGASPVQNVGAYGHEVAETISTIRVLDRLTGSVHVKPYQEFSPGYRDSDLKRSTRDPQVAGGTIFSPTGRWVVVDVTFTLERSELSAPIAYAELAARLGVSAGDRAPAAELRDTVIELRRSKGMVSDAADHDTWSAGSFFTNPIVGEKDAATLPPDVPRYPAVGGVKTSAAFLIQNAGFPKGFSIGGGAALSDKHVLALTNRGGATAEDVLALARHVRDGVSERYGIVLVNEPVLVGLEL